MDKLKMETEDLTSENIEKLKELFPSVVSDGKIDFDKLKQELSADIVKTVDSYDFTWVGKHEAVRKANEPVNAVLRPCPEESKNWEKTKNIYIEGDNLDVLKVLYKSYAGQIKMIYIDPPYNTGKDFIYDDNFTQNMKEYNAVQHLSDEQGLRLKKVTDTDGNYHSKWCSMMYPRLKMARKLLSEDGVIFISIDDHEQANLKKICDEIFGAENYIETFNVQVRYENKSLNEKDDFQKLVEYIFIYAFNKKNFIPKKTSSKYDLSKFCYKITEISEGEEITLGKKKVKIFKDGQYIIEKSSNFGTGYLKATWASGSVLKGNTSGKFFDTQLSMRKNIDGLGVLYKVYGIGEDGLGYRYFTGPKKADATKGIFYSGIPLDRLKELKEGNAIKYNPIINFYNYSADFGNIRQEGGIAFNSGKKPVKMLKKLLEISNLESADIVLDFFSGSASMAHAVMQLNAEDGGNRKFIMVQVPEPCDEKSEYKNICEIGKERIRRAGEKIVADTGRTDLDIGFRVFKLDSSNMKDVYFTPDELIQKEGADIEDLADNVKPDRTPADLLFGVMQYWNMTECLGLPHATKEIDGCTIHIIQDGQFPELVACFDADVSETVIKEMAALNPLRAVFRERCFKTTQDRLNAERLLKNADIRLI